MQVVLHCLVVLPSANTLGAHRTACELLAPSVVWSMGWILSGLEQAAPF